MQLLRTNQFIVTIQSVKAFFSQPQYYFMEEFYIFRGTFKIACWQTGVAAPPLFHSAKAWRTGEVGGLSRFNRQSSLLEQFSNILLSCISSTPGTFCSSIMQSKEPSAMTISDLGLKQLEKPVNH